MIDYISKAEKANILLDDAIRGLKTAQNLGISGRHPKRREDILLYSKKKVNEANSVLDITLNPEFSAITA
jgi:hypothetical protein